jgi:hypothetical protein
MREGTTALPRARRRASACALLAAASAACGDPSQEAPAPAAPEPEPVMIRDANNYRATGSLSIARIETAPAADLEICWSGLDKDLLCHDVSPATDIDNLGLARIARLSHEEIEAKLAADDLQQSSVDGYADYPTVDGTTCARLSSFTLFGTPIDLEEHYVAGGDRSYLLLFTTGTALAVGSRSMLFLEPREGSSRTRVDAPSGCGTLDFSADLAVAEPLVVPARGPWVLDWGELVHNGLGNEIFHSTIDRALVGFYAGRTLSELESGIFDLERSATELYAVQLGGESITDLSLAREATTGAEFTGFEREDAGIWLFGLLCGTCPNPAPLLLTPLAVGEEGA